MIPIRYDIPRVRDLVAQYGSPLYVFDGGRFKSSFKKLEDAIRAQYSNYRIAYSVKTNYTPYLCTLVKKCGGIAEVVSRMEYQLARSVGFDPADIIFNGPYKHGALELALLEGSTVVLDNKEEVERVLEIAAANPEVCLHLGVRLNFDMMNGKVSRFGFDVASDDLKLIMGALRGAGNVSLDGVHCHFTGARSLEMWRYRTETVVRFCQESFEAPPRFIDLGSGMYGELEEEFSKQFSFNIPSFDEYAAVIAEPLNKAYAFLDESDRPTLITEPGTTLVANACEGIARVEAIKEVRGKFFAILDSSQHILGGLSASKNLPLQVVRAGDVGGASFYDDLDFVGYTCLEYDVLYRGFRGQIGVGDYVVFGNIGSYSIGMKPPFILPCCAAVAFDDEHEGAFMIKREETLFDVFATYRFDC